ncbi:NAD kinase [Alkalihalobacillus sp. AL-G]|uniref:NAD kinase n=1 Tax=Alkalihalobacillus sp. AL-G TaxID=2926399 RepID=UPI00272CFCC2|nr:NAD kinase [Alkalihalobacillus sp. AL-G]WLD92379.1 NAD kinase [Alkalihalobacillus sp. AL-G]
MPERKNIHFFYRKGTQLQDKIDRLKNIAIDYGFNLVDHFRDANIIASIGGDGTFLQAVRKTGFLEDVLYVGVSTGQLGFYCDFDIDDISGMLDAMLNEQIEVRRYPTIKVQIDKDSSFYCLNECSIRSGIIKTLSLDLYIDDLFFERFKGDGMVISTPTGSTAYNKSLNGSIVDPMLSCMQISEVASINNNHYRTLGSSFILSSARALEIRMVDDGNTSPIIGMDNEALSIRNNEFIRIELSGKRIKTVKLKDNSFWHKVKRSFL